MLKVRFTESNDLISPTDLFFAKATTALLGAFTIGSAIATLASFTSAGRKALPSAIFREVESWRFSALGAASAVSALALSNVTDVAEKAGAEAANNAAAVRAARNVAALRAELDKKAAGEQKGIS